MKQENCNCGETSKKKSCRKRICKIVGWTLAGVGTLAGLYFAGKKGYLGGTVKNKLTPKNDGMIVVEEVYTINPRPSYPHHKSEYRKENNWSKTSDHKLNNK